MVNVVRVSVNKKKQHGGSEHNFVSNTCQVVLLVVGVMVFVMNKPSKKSADTHVVFEWSARSAWGLLLVFGALVCDGFYGPMQNKIKSEYKGLTAHHNMLSMNLIQVRVRPAKGSCVTVFIFSSRRSKTCSCGS